MKIAVYDDSPVFGGHQVMVRRGIEALAAEPNIEIIPSENSADFKKLKPDLILCIQGDISQSAKGITAAKRAGIECVSYLALPHRMADMGAKLGTIRDLKNQPLFNAPDRFITISESMKQIMLERGCTKPITVVPNGIPNSGGGTTSVSSLNTIGLVGRIEFKQKQQDFMIRTFLNNSVFEDYRLLIVGSGPDQEKLKQMISGQERITLLSWQEEMEKVYEQIDLLVIPSRYEGVPLVMLEALVRGIPVIGSARDGMKDLLPPEWIFEPENADALTNTFSAVRKSWDHKIESIQSKVLKEHALDCFRENFIKAVLGS